LFEQQSPAFFIAILHINASVSMQFCLHESESQPSVQCGTER
jgi:hypothetical protein